MKLTRMTTEREMPSGAERVSLAQAILHSRQLVDYVCRSEEADREFWASLGTGAPHIYNSASVLNRWIEQQNTVVKARAGLAGYWQVHRCFDHLDIVAFVAGFLMAVMLFLPEIAR